MVKSYLFLFVCIPIYIFILIIQYPASTLRASGLEKPLIIQLRNSSPLPKDTFNLSTVDNERLFSICLYLSRRCLYYVSFSSDLLNCVALYVYLLTRNGP